MDSTPSSTASGAASPFRRPPARPTTSPAARPSPAFGPVPGAPLTARPSVPSAPPAAPSTVASGTRRMLEQRRLSGARWFYWVAGLSLVNSLASLADQHWRFILGLGLTRLADALAAHSGRGITVVAVMDAATVGGFVLLGRFAQQGRVWAFGVGAVVYALDGLIFLGLRDWIGVAFHVFVLVMTVRGLDAARRLT